MPFLMKIISPFGGVDAVVMGNYFQGVRLVSDFESGLVSTNRCAWALQVP
jgi:hypothetical protein